MASPDLFLPLPGSGKLLTPDGVFRKNLKGPIETGGWQRASTTAKEVARSNLFQFHIFMRLWRQRPCDAMKGYHKRPGC
jgi:hypothetical protein